MRNISIKKVVSMLLAILLLISMTACGKNKDNPASSDVPAPTETNTEINEDKNKPGSESEITETISAGKDTPCTDEEIAQIINTDEFLFNEKWCKYLVTHQDYLPEDVLICLNEHIGEYKMVNLAKNNDETEFSKENMNTVAAVLQLHGYTPKMLLAMNSAPLSADDLSARVSENTKYMVNSTTYPKPEDGDDFLPYFAANEPDVLDEALGVTLSAPREITDRTSYNMAVELGTSITRCALISNNSYKRIQLIPASEMTTAEWKKAVPDYDPSLVLDWAPKPGTKNSGTDLIPLGAANVLEPGESTVARISYAGRGGEELDFYTRFSYYVTDGKSTELLAGVVLNHIRPSEFPNGKCTVSGTVYDDETRCPVPFIDIQTSRTGNFVTTDIKGRFTIEVPAFQFDSTGNWARTTVFVNELGVLSSGGAMADDTYAQESIIIEPHIGESMDLTLVLKQNPKQVNYTLQTKHDMKMQAYGFDAAADIIATAPFHTAFSEEYKYENGYLHVFDKTGALLFEKPLYGEVRTCDVSTDGKLIATIVHGKNKGEPDTAVVWDIEGNEVFSYQIPYVDNDALYVKPDAPRAGVFSNLHDAEISNDNTMLAIQTDEGYVCVVRMADGANICGFYMKSGNNHKLLFSADDKVIYTASECGDLRATEIISGNVLWGKYIESMIMDYVLTDTSVITSSKATGVGYLICTELATGKTLWTLDVGMRCAKMSLSHDQKTLFWGTDTGGTNSGQMFVDMETGTPLWSTVSGKQAAAFSADDRYVAIRSGGNLQLWTTTGEHLYGAIIAPDDNSMCWGIYMSADCKYIISFAGGSVADRYCGVMYALTLDEDTPLE